MAFVSSILMVGLGAEPHGIVLSIYFPPGRRPIMVTWMQMPRQQVIMFLAYGHGWTERHMKQEILHLTTLTLHPAKSDLVDTIMTRSVVLGKWVNLFFIRVCSRIPIVRKLRAIWAKNGEFSWIRGIPIPTKILISIRVLLKLPKTGSVVPWVNLLSTAWRPRDPPLGLGWDVPPTG